MEITREKPADLRVSDQSSPKQPGPGPDVISTLEQGTRFQATVVESKGLFAMIDIGESQTLKARSNSPLPQGANVQLEVTEAGNPVQVRLVSITSQEQDQQTLQAQALNREMLNMRARLSALHSVFSKYSVPGKDQPVNATTDVSDGKRDDLTDTLLKGIQQGTEADPAKVRGMSALLQPSPSSGKSMLEAIVSTFRTANQTSETGPADSRPVRPDTGIKATTAQGTGTAQPRPATSQHGPAGPAHIYGTGDQVTDQKPYIKQGMTAGLQPDPSPPSKDNGFTPLVRMQSPSSGLKPGDGDVASRQPASPNGHVRQQAASTPEGTGDTQHIRPAGGASRRILQPSITKPSPQERIAGDQKPHIPPHAKDSAEPEGPGHSEYLDRNSQPSSERGQAHAATGKDIASPNQPVSSSKPTVTSHSKATVTTGGKAGFRLDENLSPKTGTHTLRGDTTTPGPTDTTASQVSPKGAMPSVEPGAVRDIIAGTAEHAESSQIKTARPDETPQRPFAASKSPAHRIDSPGPALQHRGPAWHTQKDRSGPGGTEPAHDDQAVQPQNSPQQADRPASHDSGILRFFNALASHGQSLHQYQQQVQDFLNVPFFMAPLWFENGQGHGHWSWWKEEAEHDGDDRGEVEHLAFDLELTGLGRINMHLLRQDHGLSLHAAASREVLPILRAGMQELKERMESIGFTFTVADIFPIEDTDPTELLSPIPPADRMSTSSVSIIA